MSEPTKTTEVNGLTDATPKKKQKKLWSATRLATCGYHECLEKGGNGRFFLQSNAVVNTTVGRLAECQHEFCVDTGAGG